MLLPIKIIPLEECEPTQSRQWKASYCRMQVQLRTHGQVTANAPIDIYARFVYYQMLVIKIRTINFLNNNRQSTNMLIILLVLCVSITARINANYTKIIHNTDPEAKCLDGSSPMVYLHEGGDNKKILFHLIGGGACLGTDTTSTLQSCYRRSHGQFGSSTKWPETYDGTNGGVLSPLASQSAFANWTKIIFMYCDGAFHQGNNLNPIQYKDTKLYFRGAVNTRSHFKWANNKYNLSNAEKIVLTGSSAGGMAVYMWHQYLKDLVTHPERVYSVADSGIFYDPLIKSDQHLTSQSDITQTFRYKLISQSLGNQPNDDPNPVKILMKLSNSDERPPNKECSDLLTAEQQWKCIFIEFSYATIKSPILFLESSYDQFVIEAVFNFKCVKEGVSGYTLKDCANWQIDAIQLYRTYYLQKFLPTLLKYGHSIWSISCCWHARMFDSVIYDSPLQKVPKNEGRTMRNATEAFILENKRIEAVDLFAWPANSPCAY